MRGAAGLWLGVQGYHGWGAGRGHSGVQRYCSWDARTPWLELRAVQGPGGRAGGVTVVRGVRGEAEGRQGTVVRVAAAALLVCRRRRAAGY